MSGPLVTVVASGGVPVTAVDSGAPLVTAGIGGPAVTMVESGGAPFIVEGAAVASLFVDGEQGAWFDPSDMGTMFQDAAGTVAAVVGQPVGLIRDKSGNGHHASQATDALRPTLMQDGGLNYLSFTNHVLVTSAMDFSGGDEATLFAGIRRLTDTPSAMLALMGAGTTLAAAGSFMLFAPGSGANSTFRTIGAAALSNAVASSAAPQTRVITGIGKIGTDTAIIRTDGVQRATSATVQGARNYLNAPLYIGRNQAGTAPFNGRLYGLIVRSAITADPGPVEQYLAGKTGLSF